MRIFKKVYLTLWFFVAITATFFAVYWHVWRNEFLATPAVFVFVALIFLGVSIQFLSVKYAEQQIVALLDLPDELCWGDVPLRTIGILNTYRDDARMQRAVASLAVSGINDRTHSQEIYRILIVRLSENKTDERIVQIFRNQLDIHFESALELFINKDTKECLENHSVFPQEDKWRDYFSDCLGRALVLGGKENYEAICTSLVLYLRQHFSEETSIETLVYMLMDACLEARNMPADDIFLAHKALRQVLQRSV